MEFDDVRLEDLSLADVVAGFASDVEGIFPFIDVEDGLSDDDKADLVKKFEEILELVTEAKKILTQSSDEE